MDPSSQSSHDAASSTPPVVGLLSLDKASADLASLQRVSHRLAMTEESRLSSVLDKLLPRLLKRIGENHDQLLAITTSSSTSSTSTSSLTPVTTTAAERLAVKTKLEAMHLVLVEMLSHCMKRVKADAHCQLPCQDILEQLALLPHPINPFTINLSLAFLTLGIPRTPEPHRLLPYLIRAMAQSTNSASSSAPASSSLSASELQQHTQLAHLLLRSVERVVTERTVSPTHESLDECRRILVEDSVAGNAVYQLLLDVLLYEPVIPSPAMNNNNSTATRNNNNTSSIPPNGLSPHGANRLENGHSTTETSWKAEMALPKRRSDVKLALLDLIAPTRLALFLQEGGPSISLASLGLARTVALLIVACGDPSRAVAERGATYWKAYRDSQRQVSADAHRLLHLPIASLSIELLSLCLGQIHSDAALVPTGIVHSSVILWLSPPPPVLASAPEQLSTLNGHFANKRRPVSESYFTAMVEFVAKLLEENPRALEDPDDVEEAELDDITAVGNGPNGPIPTTKAVALLGVATLAVRVAKSKLRSASVAGLTALRAKPWIVAAQVLQAVSIRLAMYCDSHSQGGIDNRVSNLLGQALVLACSTVAGAAQRRVESASNLASASFGSAGNLAVRDACYGVICTISRSKLAIEPRGLVFSCGEPSTSTATAATQLSSETAKLLFGCATNEEEPLRPRAVAALDALLGAYQSWLTHITSNTEMSSLDPSSLRASIETNDIVANPWDVQPTSTSCPPKTMRLADRALLARSLLPLLWNAAQPYQTKSSRLAAAQWTRDLLKALELTRACHLLCFLAGDADSTVGSIAIEGLGLTSLTAPLSEHWALTTKNCKLPAFSETIQAVFPPEESDSSGRRIQRYQEFSARGKAAALRFGVLCLMNDFYDSDSTAVKVYLTSVCETLRSLQRNDGTTPTGNGPFTKDLLDDCSACLVALLTASEYARSCLIRQEMGLNLQDLVHLSFGVASSRARRELAAASGLLYESFDFWSAFQEGESKFTSWVKTCQIDESLKSACRVLQSLVSTGGGASSSAIHGSAYLGARAGKAVRMAALHFPVADDTIPTEVWASVALVLTALGRGTRHSDDVVANACSDGIGIALSYHGISAPVLDSHLNESCSVVLSELTEAIAKYGHGDFMDSFRLTKLVRAAGICLAATTIGDGLGSARLLCVNSMFNLLGSSSFRKDEEIALVVGESLALYADALESGTFVWSSSPEERPTEFSETYASLLPPHEHVIYVLLEKIAKSSSPHLRRACAPALLAVVARVARGISSDPSYGQRALPVEVTSRLESVQDCFIKCLADPKITHLPRESCCIALAACRSIAGAFDPRMDAQEELTNAFNSRLLRAFGQTTSFEGSAFMETPAQAAERRARESGSTNPTTNDFMEGDEGAGGAAGLSEASLGAYREMAAASVALGRHDVLYGLLMLSVSHPCWSDSTFRDNYSTNSILGGLPLVGNGSISTELQQALRPHLGNLIPRILRARHDPNKQTRDQMTALWNGLTGGGADARLAVTQHFLSTFDCLIKDSTNKLWRTRVGACGALSEIIVGRTWDDLGGGGPVLGDDIEIDQGKVTGGTRLLSLWRVTMRAVDDVRGVVRECGATLGRAVRSLTFRLCDPEADKPTSGAKRGRSEGQKAEKDATSASATSLRWLIQRGLEQQCPEAAGLCISTLVQLVGIVKPIMLSPILPDLLRSLLMAISGLEPAALSFLQLRTSDQEGLEKIRLKIAQTGPLAEAITKCLELLPGTDSKTQHSVASQLDTALRMSAGFATRAAVADSVSTLCSSCPSVFRFGLSSNANPSVRLLRALYYASERERASASKDKMFHALGSLAALCPGPSVRSLALRACERYNRSNGSFDDPASRRAAASAIRAIVIRASDQLGDGGNGDIWRTRVLPIAFIGRKDSEKTISSLWQEVWSEGETISPPDTQSFGTRLEETLLPFIVVESSRALRDVSWARRAAGANAIVELVESGILAPQSRATGSKAGSVSKAELARARSRAQASAAALRTCLNIVSKPRIWTGKSLVLQASIDLVSKWIGAEVSNDANATILYGWEGGSICPWKPVSLQFSTSDLFVGDGWFTQHQALETDDDDSIPSGDAIQDVTSSPTVNVEELDNSCIDFSNIDDTEALEIQVSDAEALDDEPSHAPLSFFGFFRLMLDQSCQNSQALSDEYLPYKAGALQGLRSILNSLPLESDKAKVFVFLNYASRLLTIFVPDPKGVVPSQRNEPPPVAVARALEALSSMIWEGIGTSDDLTKSVPTYANGSPAPANVPSVDDLLTLFQTMVGHHAWTVREASGSGASALALRSDSRWLRQHRVISTLVQCAETALKDRKFWKVRCAGFQVLQSLVRRVGPNRSTRDEAQQFLLEAVLPHKEDILRLLNLGIKDSEAPVTALCSSVLIDMSWWP